MHDDDRASGKWPRGSVEVYPSFESWAFNGLMRSCTCKGMMVKKIEEIVYTVILPDFVLQGASH